MPAITVKLTRSEIDEAIREYLAENYVTSIDDTDLSNAKLTFNVTNPKKGTPQVSGVTVEIVKVETGLEAK